MTWKTAKFAGRCTTCGGAVMVGDRIDHSPAFGVVVCPSCDDTEPRAGRATESDCPLHCARHAGDGSPDDICPRCGLDLDPWGRKDKEAADDRALFHSMEMDGFV